MTILNYTPHSITLNDGTVYPSVGIARVSAEFKQIGKLFYSQEFGDIVGLPEPKEDTIYIVSFMVLLATYEAGRRDCVAPATGHPDCIRDKNGFIKSVPGFVL